MYRGSYFYVSIFILGLGLVLSILPAQANAAIGDVPTYGLVGHWMFDTSTGSTTDSSGNGYTATMNNGPTVVTGIAGDALNFATTTGSSNNYVSFPAGLQNAGFPASGTLSFWIKGTFSTQAGRVIFPTTASGNNIYVNVYTGGRLQINLQDAAGNYVGPNGQIISASTGSNSNFPISDNTWTLFTIVWDTANKIEYVYQNGSPIFSAFFGKYAPTWTPNSETFRINAPGSGSVSDRILRAANENGNPSCKPINRPNE